MPVLSEGQYQSDVILFEGDNRYSRDMVTILSGQNLKKGSVLGRRTTTTAVAAAGTNTGNGTMGAVAVNVNAIPGVYTVRIVSAATNAGGFTVTDPQGDRLSDGTVGQAYSSTHLSFTLADGSTDFVVGDTFSITVSGDGKYRALNPSATDGSETAAGVLVDDVDASAADKSGVALVRQALVKDTGLVWPNGITTPQRTQALADLAALGIVARTAL